MDFTSLQNSLAVHDSLVLAAVLTGAYLLGSVSSAILVCRLFGLPDPRTTGSQNPGATNVLRLGNRLAALLTLAGDILKGVLPVLLARFLDLPLWAAAMAGFFAFIGHLHPVFFGFRGGKGVATAFGVLFSLAWPVGVLTGLVWLVAFAAGRISSVASLSAFLVSPALMLHWLPEAFWPNVLMSALMLYRHKSNIRNLLSGSEAVFRKK